MRVQLKSKRVQKKGSIMGGNIFKSIGLDTGKVRDLTKMMNTLYEKEMPRGIKKLVGRKFVI